MTKVVPAALLVRAARYPAYRRFLQECANVRASQEASLRRLVEALGRTRLARRLNVPEATSLDLLRTKVPLVRYDDLAPEIEATLRGEVGAMVADRPMFFALTSGTSGSRKTIPVTDAFRREFQLPMNVYIYGIARDHPRAVAGKTLYFVASAHTDTAPSGTPMGATSGYNFLHVPRPLRSLYAAPYPAFAITHPVSRSYAIALTALRHDVSFIVAVTTHPVAQLGHVMGSHGDALLRDLEHGTLNPPTPMTDAERRALEPVIRKAPKRARALREAAARHGKLSPKIAWPRLALISTWFHGGAGACAHELDALYGKVPRRTAVYSATEAWFNVPLEDDHPWGALALGASVFEFLPIGANGEPDLDAPTLAHEVEAGKRYEIVVSSGAGLFRYRMGDEVLCTGHLGEAPLIQFVQKVGNSMSLAHDLTSETHVEVAVTELRAKGLEVGRYCFAPAPPSAPKNGPPRYALFVEATGGLADRARAVATTFDEALRRANSGYDDERVDNALAPALVVLVAPAKFAAWDEEGARVSGAQAKPRAFAKDAATVAPLFEGSEVVDLR